MLLVYIDIPLQQRSSNQQRFYQKIYEELSLLFGFVGPPMDLVTQHTCGCDVECHERRLILEDMVEKRFDRLNSSYVLMEKFFGAEWVNPTWCPLDTSKPHFWDDLGVLLGIFLGAIFFTFLFSWGVVVNFLVLSSLFLDVPMSSFIQSFPLPSKKKKIETLSFKIQVQNRNG